ncbi:hypothetical protein EGW08_013738 [Elysia chlorotica]|uniref:Uncharacterized protein n=1 Tax=Elysia chlorotica TaxID=188477 RepID=A0A433TA88_ELYCH|nr:hypothetical protein EGW08_013738 [Elysia chlorotica]
MAATCLGSFGSYKLQYSRYLKERLEKEKSNPPEVQTVWVTKRYAPTGKSNIMAIITPVVMTKLCWMPQKCFLKPLSRLQPTKCPPPPLPAASRCEDWSTLRQMLPPYATVVRVGQPRWGVTQAPPPTPSGRMPYRFPHINSCMTNYVDEMALTNRQFKHC